MSAQLVHGIGFLSHHFHYFKEEFKAKDIKGNKGKCYDKEMLSYNECVLHERESREYSNFIKSLEKPETASSHAQTWAERGVPISYVFLPLVSFYPGHSSCL